VQVVEKGGVAGWPGPAGAAAAAAAWFGWAAAA
jgi:hypothetical protein